jgi:uncharacterized membrane protein
MRVRLLSLWYRLRSSLWTFPAVMSVAAAFLAVLLGRLDVELAKTDPWWMDLLLYRGDLAGARALLTTVASSMITVAGVAFSTTVVALSLASSQFGPRLLSNFMRDRGNQIVLGTFIATFLFCLMALRSGGGAEEVIVPRVSATVALLLAICSLGLLIYFIHHVSTSMHAENVVAAVSRDLAATVDRLVPHVGEEAVSEAEAEEEGNENLDGDGAAVASASDGYIQAVDDSGLVEVASAEDLVLRIHRRAGHFVVAGERLATAVGATRLGDDAVARVQRCFLIGRRHSDEQDPEYGIHQLVEVALRALSPGINDPFTAIACIDWLGGTMAKIGSRRLRSPRRRDVQGRLRVVTDPITFTGLLSASFDQIRQNAADHPAVSIRLLEALRAVAGDLRDKDRREPVRIQAEMIHAAARQRELGEKDRRDIDQRFEAVLEALDARVEA